MSRPSILLALTAWVFPVSALADTGAWWDAATADTGSWGDGSTCGDSSCDADEDEC